jgi:hypothetical protein
VIITCVIERDVNNRIEAPWNKCNPVAMDKSNYLPIQLPMRDIRLRFALSMRVIRFL